MYGQSLHHELINWKSEVRREWGSPMYHESDRPRFLYTQSQRDDKMFRGSLLILLILGTCGSQAKIVNHIDPNQYELELEERGTRLTQKIRFDVDGLRITEVPAHNELLAATYVFDSSKVKCFQSIRC